MLDRNSSDRLNPVFMRLMRELMRTRILLGICALMLLFSLCFAYLFLSMVPEDTEFLGAFVAFAIPICLLCCGGNVVAAIHQARNVDGMDPGLGTTLPPGRILAGQLLALLAACAVPLACAIPLVALCKYHGCISLTGLAISVAWDFVILTIILAALQFNAIGMTAGKSFSPLWLALAVFLLPAIGLIFFLPVILNKISQESGTSLYLFAQAWAAASLMVLSGAVIYGANRPRTLDSTVTFHLTLLAVWLLSLPVLLVCYVLYPNWGEHIHSPVTAWGGLTTLFGGAMLFLASLEPLSPSRRLCDFLRRGANRAHWLTLPFQGGAVPGFLLGLLLCLVGTAVLACQQLPADEQFPALHFAIAVCYGLFYTALAMGLRRCFKLSAGAAYAAFFAVGALATLCDVIISMDAPAHASSPFGLVTGGYFMEKAELGYPNYLFLLVGLLGLFIFIYFNLKPFIRETAERN